MFCSFVSVSMVTLLPLVTLCSILTSLRTVFCLNHNLLELRRLRTSVSGGGNSFCSIGLTRCCILNTYLPQYIVHYIICLGNDSSVRQPLKSITEWLSVNKNKFYTLTQVWGHSYKEPVFHYFPDIRSLLYTTSQRHQLKITTLTL